MDLDGKLLAGIQEFEGQRYSEAQRIAAEILEVDANNSRALNLLGMSLHRQGLSEQGAALVAKAKELRPDYAAACNNLATIYREKGDLESALRYLDQAIRLVPDTADSYQNKALILFEMGKFEQSADCLNRCISLNSRLPEAHTNLGLVLSKLGRLPEALASHDKAIALDPTCVAALVNRGIVLDELKRPREALASYDRAIALKPDFAEAFSNRASTLRDLARPEEALASSDRALAIKPEYPEALDNRGGALCDLKRFAEALESYDRALAFKPDYLNALINRASVLRDLKRPEEALATCDRGLAIRPDDPVVLNQRGSALSDLKRYAEALASYDRALAFKPDYRDALHNRGYLLAVQNRHEEAAQSYGRLLELAPDHEFLKGELLHQEMLCCDWSEYAVLARQIEEDVRAGRMSAEPFGYQAMTSSVENLRRCAEIFTGCRFPRAATQLYAGERYDNPKIRIGYLSGEFRQQATSVLMTELFELHDKDRFALFAFDNGWDDASELRARINRAFDEVIDISRLSDADAAAAVRQRRIDILVNLNGYFGHGRQGVFAHRPSPIQVNYLGFPGTLGADYMDYILADQHVIPPEERQYYAEKVVYLPDTYQVNDLKRRISERTPTRPEAGLPDAGFVFCCFNNNYKITPEVFAVWMRLLAKVEGSVLWLLEDNAAAARNLRREAEARGVPPGRLVFAKRLKLDEHLSRHKLGDLFLDTLPYNAHTTASDALWAGLPLLTCQGSTFPGRVAASLLHAVGLPELVTRTLREYEEWALRLASTPAMLADIRAKLARNRTSHPLFNSDRYRHHLESAYQSMWNRHQCGEPPESFPVQPC
jgi:predicted O-linked N-acetylglucosamine transferase (SPINDLY family)